jgi:hypothetical protein
MPPQRKVYIADRRCPQLPNPCYVDMRLLIFSVCPTYVLEQSFTDTSIYTKPVESNGNEISLILYGYTLGKLITVSTSRMGPPLPFTDNLSSSWSMYPVHCVPMILPLLLWLAQARLQWSVPRCADSTQRYMAARIGTINHFVGISFGIASWNVWWLWLRRATLNLISLRR